MIPQAIAVMNGKGGVGKTSLVANLAGLAAAAGWRVLAVDLDQQGNLESRLGYQDRSDQGDGLVAAALDLEPLVVVEAVRPNLDAVAGGAALRNLPNELIRRVATGVITDHRAATWLDEALAPLARRYDLVVFDTPPSGSAIHLAAAVAAHYVVVPTAPDRDSIEGLAEIATLFAEVLDSWNRDIELLGVALTLLVTGAVAIERRARDELGSILAPGLPVFDRTIRFAQKAATHFAERGVLAHEYESEAAAAEPWFSRLRPPPEREPGSSPDETLTPGANATARTAPDTTGEADETSPVAYSSAASGLAADYEGVVNEILSAFSVRRQAMRRAS
ncbi:MAG: ParA family protein [Acidimicrobiia bacterium]|nr:ParA family protein [Acidimicrobiia bacterium]